MKRFAAVFLGVSLVLTGFALGAEKVQEGHGGLLIGVANRNLESLNARMRAGGYETFPSTALMFGGWGWGSKGKWMLGGSGSGFWKRVGGQVADATLSGGMGFFELGYKLESAKASQVIGLAGFGGGGYTLKLVPHEVEQDFDNILRSTRTGSQLGSGQVLGKVGLQLDWIGPKIDKEKRTNLTVGVRLEYVFGITSPAWNVETSELHNAPDVSFSGFSLTLAVGFRGIQKSCD